MKWFIKCYKHYFDFKGRARRKEYWMFMLFFVLFFFACYMIDIILFADIDAISNMNPSEMPQMSEIPFFKWFPVSILFAIVSFIPSLAVLVRRLHDTSHSGYWVLGYYALYIVTLLLPAPTKIASLCVFLLFVLSVTLLVFMVKDSVYEENKWGECEKLEEPEEVLE